MREQLLDFLEYIKEEKKFSNNTVISYKHDIENFMSFLDYEGVKSFEDYCNVDVEKYIKYLSQNGRTVSTVSRNMASIRCFFKYLNTKGIIKHHSNLDFKIPKAGKKNKKEALSPDVFDRILFQVPNNMPGKRDKAMLYLLCCTKVSISELVSIDIDSFNQTTRELKLKSGNVVLPYNAFAYMLDYLDNCRKKLLLNKAPVNTLFLNCNGNPLSRQGFWKTIKKYIKLADLSDDITLQNLKNLKAI